METQYLFKEYNASIKRQIIYNKYKDKIFVDSSAAGYKSITQVLRQVLLPSGWPHSVSDDYIEYQIWDSIQAFSSSITGVFATRAILTGVGVGNTDARPLSATITWILKDGTGMLGRIVFAWLKGRNLDTECKKWRLAADALNDAALGVEISIPLMIGYANSLLCVSTMMKAIVGVAGGATRAAVTQHQALRGNTGDVSAKDGSQETFVNLLASLIGLILLTYFENYDWILFFVFTFLHLYANYKAVKALNLKTLNEERYTLLLFKYFSLTHNIAGPKLINEQESVFLGIGFKPQRICNFKLQIGCAMQEASTDINVIETALEVFETDPYILILGSKRFQRKIFIFLKSEETPDTVLKAFFHGIIYSIALSSANRVCFQFPEVKNIIKSLNLRTELKNSNSECIEDLSIEDKIKLKHFVNKEYAVFKAKALKEGWTFNSHHLNVDEWRYL